MRLFTRYYIIFVISMLVVGWGYLLTPGYQLPRCSCSRAKYTPRGDRGSKLGAELASWTYAVFHRAPLNEAEPSLVCQAACQNMDVTIQDIEALSVDYFRRYGHEDSYGTATFTAFDPVSETFNNAPILWNSLIEARHAICVNALLMFFLFHRKKLRSLLALGTALACAMLLVGLLT